MNEREACRQWVGTFSFVPQEVIEKLAQIEDSCVEITPPAEGDRAVTDFNATGIIEKIHSENQYDIRLDDGRDISLPLGDFYVSHDEWLPMTGMWAFKDSLDDMWLEGEFGDNGLEAMAKCGFRIYKQEDYGYIFGIDGAGYDFYESHWLPLYRARGLRWHDDDGE